MLSAPYRKLPVKSLTPGLSIVSARKFAPRETSFRLRSHPCTPPGVASRRNGFDVDRYRVPVTMSRLCVFCRLCIHSVTCPGR